MRTALFFIFIFLITTAFVRPEDKELNACLKRKAGTHDTSYTVLKYDTIYYWIFKDVKPADLSADEITELNKMVTECFDFNKEVLMNQKKYKLQYMPVINAKGEKEVWINCFCEDFGDSWKKKIILVQDGGECFCNFKVNLTTKKYYDLMINGNG